jgi:hypothetical protein
MEHLKLIEKTFDQIQSQLNEFIENFITNYDNILGSIEKVYNLPIISL